MILEKYLNVKFHQNPSSGIRVVPCRRTDGHDEANNRFSQLCESAWKWVLGMAFVNVEQTKQILYGVFTQAIQFATADMSVIPSLGDVASTYDVL